MGGRKHTYTHTIECMPLGFPAGLSFQLRVRVLPHAPNKVEQNIYSYIKNKNLTDVLRLNEALATCSFSSFPLYFPRLECEKPNALSVAFDVNACSSLLFFLRIQSHACFF